MRLVGIGGAAVLTALVALSAPASGALIVTQAQGDGSAWIHPDPIIRTDGGNPPNYFTSGESLSSGGTLAQTFTPTVDFILDKIDVAYTSSAASTIGVRIAESETRLNDAETAYVYTRGTVLVDLTFALDVATGGTKVLTLDFTGSDQVSLKQGQQYVLEFYDPGLGSVSFGLRRRGSDLYSGGMLFKNGTSVNNLGHRDAPIQIFEVPEPSALAGLGLAGVAMLGRRRGA